jgi:phage baseplate assembly protein gpV
MSFGDDIVNTIQREVGRALAGRHNQRAGLVTAWDSQKHLAKVMFQPEGHETGWIKVHTMAAGNGNGHMTGLTPGDGKTTGDQVLVNYQEGDFETGAITARLHSKVDAPPTVLAGEQLLSTPVGHSIKMANDKSTTIEHPNGNYMKMDASGNIFAYIQNTAQQVYLGGDPSKAGTFAPVETSFGPSPYVQARVS